MQALAYLCAAEVEEEDDAEERADEDKSDVFGGVEIEVASGKQKVACSDDGPAPAPQAKEAEDADHHERADAEDAIARQSGAIDATQRREGVEHGKQQKIHADEGHAGEHAFKFAGRCAGRMGRAD